jgi:hypothetical protein
VDIKINGVSTVGETGDGVAGGVGGAGVAAAVGVTEFDGLDGRLVPTLLTAVTTKV